jgi:hypothetical protein
MMQPVFHHSKLNTISSVHSSVGERPMSDARIFFAGMGTTVLLLGAGFSGGLMLASTAIDSLPQNKVTAADRLQPARVVLPTTTEAAPAVVQPAAAPEPAATSKQPAQAQNLPAKEMQAAAAKAEQSERAERRRTEYADRESGRRFAERKAGRDAARLKQQRDQQRQEARPQERPGIMALDFDEDHRRPGGFFGN